MKVKNPYDEARWIPDLDLTVEPGESIEVPQDVGRSLVAQRWEAVPADKAAKATKDKE